MLRVVFIIRKEVASHPSPLLYLHCRGLVRSSHCHPSQSPPRDGAVREPSSLWAVLVHPPASLPWQWTYVWEGQTRSSPRAWRLATVSPGWTLLLCVCMYVHTTDNCVSCQLRKGVSPSVHPSSWALCVPAAALKGLISPLASPVPSGQPGLSSLLCGLCDATPAPVSLTLTLPEAGQPYCGLLAPSPVLGQ